MRGIFAKRVLLRATTRVAPTFQAEQAHHVGATLVVALLPAHCIPHLQKSHAHPRGADQVGESTYSYAPMSQADSLSSGRFIPRWSVYIRDRLFKMPGT